MNMKGWETKYLKTNSATKANRKMYFGSQVAFGKAKRSSLTNENFEMKFADALKSQNKTKNFKKIIAENRSLLFIILSILSYSEKTIAKFNSELD